jgi:hypothetical protein
MKKARKADNINSSIFEYIIDTLFPERRNKPIGKRVSSGSEGQITPTKLGVSAD